ncbi:MAG: NAD-dependent deacetylase, partial [Acidimicrobiales bacterium]
DLGRAERAARECDLLLAVGSTLAVYPICDIVPIARRFGASVIIVNAEPTQFDDLADAVVRGSISEVLPEIIGK